MQHKHMCMAKVPISSLAVEPLLDRCLRECLVGNWSTLSLRITVCRSETLINATAEFVVYNSASHSLEYRSV